MALEYDLYLSTPVRPDHALELLASRIAGLDWSDDGSCLVDATGTLTARQPHSRTKSLYEELFCFSPTLGVGFRFVSGTDYDRFKDIMLRATMLLLEHGQDAVLVFNGETIVLQRLGGKLAVNSGYDIWDEDWLKNRIAAPFEWRAVPSPLM